MTTHTAPIPGARLKQAITDIHVCGHPTPLNLTALSDLAETWCCFACGAWWSELGTRGHLWPPPS